MNQLASRLTEIRKKNKLTQNDVAEKLNVSFQAVSLWERGETAPDISKLSDIAKLYNVTIDWLLMGKEEPPAVIDFAEPLSDRVFNEDRMYTYVKTYATVKGMSQTLKALPFAREKHKGQYRKGKEKIPYIYHPLLMACHALSLGMENDDLIATALLHDVCEDCRVLPEELPVNDNIKTAVRLLTKDDSYDKKSEESIKKYYSGIKKHPIALMVKLLDRCSNVSGMAGGFTKSRMIEYINETEKIFYPMMQYGKEEYTEYSNQIFLIKYHMASVIETIKHQLKTADMV